MGGSGCRGYVYLQIKPSVPKQYLPGLFRYTSAVKPWVQPSLYCVNLPSFSRDSISFLPPPNTPIHAPHSLCTRANKRDVAIDGGSVAGNKCLCSGSVSPRPPRSFFVTNLERAQRGDDAKFRWEEMQEDHRQIGGRDKTDGALGSCRRKKKEDNERSRICEYETR